MCPSLAVFSAFFSAFHWRAAYQVDANMWAFPLTGRLSSGRKYMVLVIYVNFTILKEIYMNLTRQEMGPKASKMIEHAYLFE